MSAVACLLLCFLLADQLAAVSGQEQSNSDEQAHPSSNLFLAAELARIASRLAGAAAHTGVLSHRHRRHPPATAVTPAQFEEAAEAGISDLQNIQKGLVQSVPVTFKGHNLTVVALTHE